MCVFLAHYRQALEMPLQKGGFVHRHWFTHASRTQMQQGCIFMYRIEGQTGIIVLKTQEHGEMEAANGKVECGPVIVN